MGSKKNLLIVENDQIVAKMWSLKLSESFNITIACSVQEALAAIVEYTPDIVLLDLRLNGPLNSGLAVYEYLRSKVAKDVSVVFITGLTYDVDLFQQAKDHVNFDTLAGRRTYLLEKPVKIKDLQEVIHSAV